MLKKILLSTINFYLDFMGRGVNFIIPDISQIYSIDLKFNLKFLYIVIGWVQNLNNST